MGHAIPKLQYNNLALTGQLVNGSGVILGVSDTSEVEVGMFLRGTGIPVGAVVGSFDQTTITLAAGVQATADAASADLNMGFEIVFDYPPVEDSGETLTSDAVVVPSLSGVRQTSVNSISAVRQLSFSFLSPALFTLMDTFLKTWALYGNDFLYFEDQTLDASTSFELDTLNNAPTNAPRKIAPRPGGLYVWEIDLTFRRVL